MTQVEQLGGRTCIQVHKDDMLEVAKFHPLQKFMTTEWYAATLITQQSDASYYDRRAVYDPSGSYVQYLEQSESTAIMLIRILLKETFGAELDGFWLSQDFQDATGITHISCSPPCNADRCENAIAQNHHIDLYNDPTVDHTKAAEVTLAWLIPIVLVIMVLAGFVIFLQFGTTSGTKVDDNEDEDDKEETGKKPKNKKKKIEKAAANDEKMPLVFKI